MIFVFLFGVSIFAQTTVKINEPKFYQGDDYMPYIFEPYNSLYSINGKFIGINFNLFKYQTRLIELDDSWSEIQNWQVPQFEDFKPEEIKITSDIDLKTGLLKKMLLEASGETEGEYIISKQEISLADNKFSVNSLATDAKGKVKESENYSFPIKEKIYPCQSNTFFSYLPLKEDFIGSFTCFMLNSEGYSAKDDLMLNKQTIAVKGSERITTKAGTFDCFVITQKSEPLGKYDQKGNFKAAKPNKVPKNFDENKVWKNFFGSCWIDKKTRKVIKAELRYKNLAGLYIELEPKLPSAV
jgi:hypothetical protein